MLYNVVLVSAVQQHESAILLFDFMGDALFLGGSCSEPLELDMQPGVLRPALSR